VLAGFVLAWAAAGSADATIRSDVAHLEQLRAWFGLYRFKTSRMASELGFIELSYAAW
jgi:hypothetical protein